MADDDDLEDLLGFNFSDIGDITVADEEGNFKSTPIDEWTHDECIAWFKEIIESQVEGFSIDSLNLEEELSGKILKDVIESTREMKDTFGLETISKRLIFEKEVTKSVRDASDLRKQNIPMRPKGSHGGIFNETFLKKIQPLYDMHMGVENMGPLLYSLIRFLKPKNVLEVGAGYTSIYILQALKDNADEIDNYKRLNGLGLCTVNDGATPWCVDTYLKNDYTKEAKLYCVDNMAHEFTTANLVAEGAKELGLADHLELLVEDIWELPNKLDKNIKIDFLWADFGCSTRLAEFFDIWWPKVNPNGGYIAVHSTLTNGLTRKWLDSMRYADRDDYEKHFGPFSTLSFMEPHKLFQNSFSIFQKKWAEPVHTKYP